jgi:hypothetical protein
VALPPAIGVANHDIPNGMLSRLRRPHLRHGGQGRKPAAASHRPGGSGVVGTAGIAGGLTIAKTLPWRLFRWIE